MLKLLANAPAWFGSCVEIGTSAQLYAPFRKGELTSLGPFFSENWSIFMRRSAFAGCHPRAKLFASATG